MLLCTFSFAVRAQQREAVFAKDAIHPAGDDVKGKANGHKVLQAALHRQEGSSDGDAAGIYGPHPCANLLNGLL